MPFSSSDLVVCVCDAAWICTTPWCHHLAQTNTYCVFPQCLFDFSGHETTFAPFVSIISKVWFLTHFFLCLCFDHLIDIYTLQLHVLDHLVISCCHLIFCDTASIMSSAWLECFVALTCSFMQNGSTDFPPFVHFWILCNIKACILIASVLVSMECAQCVICNNGAKLLIWPLSIVGQCSPVLFACLCLCWWSCCYVPQWSFVASSQFQALLLDSHCTSSLSVDHGM